MNQRICLYCQSAFVPVRVGPSQQGDRLSKHCSRSCAQLTRNSSRVRPTSTTVPWATCLRCRSSFIARRSRVRVLCPLAACQRARTNEYANRYYNRTLSPLLTRPPKNYTCDECGTDFESNTLHPHRFCSPRCSGRANKRWRKKRIRNNGPVERFTTLQIAQRDRHKCHLCKKLVQPPQRSIDHLVPVSQGGTHTSDNVRLAHTLCNSRRGVNGTVQLLLLG